MRKVGPLERRLFLTIVVGLLPLAILAFVISFRTAQHQKQELLDSSQGSMRAIVSAVDSELAASQAALDALAASPRLAKDDFTGFYTEARELMARRRNWLNIVLNDPTAQQRMNAFFPQDSPARRSVNPEAIGQIIMTGKPAVGDMVYMPGLATYAFSVQVPVFRGGNVVYVLTAVIRPNAMRQIINGQHVPENGVADVLDNQFNVVARTLHHEALVGKSAPSQLLALLKSGKQAGWGAMTTHEGAPVYGVFYRSLVTGWTAAVGIPIAAVDAPLRRSFLILGALLVASVLIGVAAAFLVSRAITQPMRELKTAAEAMGRGLMPQLIHTDLPEIHQVAAALVAAHHEREALLRTERQSRELEREARMAAEGANKLKDEFLAMLGHELRNPLAAISSASLVLDAAVGKPAAQKAIETANGIIRRQSRHLARLTDDLLDAGRVVLGRIQLDLHPIDLASAVQNSLDTLRGTGRLNQHTMTASLTPVWVKADITRLDQVISNVLTNAVKYTPAPGKIDVRVEREGQQAVLRVRDSGIGIEPELMPRIFDLFVQGERAPDRSLGGLGIGLTLVRRLTELHGGQVEVTSAGIGRGSEFVVRLPAIEPVLRNEDQALAPAVISARKVVIIEDNEDVRLSLRQTLELAGHRVSEAADGRAGVELVMHERPDVALVDIGLPLLDGYGVAQTLRALPSVGNTRLIAMSGYGNPEDIQAGLRAGFDHYLVKPIDPTKLHEILADSAAMPHIVSNVVPFSR
jgi:signal transduction histidine kinase/ActR/RegA family two-component response regulator